MIYEFLSKIETVVAWVKMDMILTIILLKK